MAAAVAQDYLRGFALDASGQACRAWLKTGERVRTLWAVHRAALGTYVAGY